MLQTKYKLDKHPGEPGGGEKLVESQGYIPAEVQIEQLISAGKRLGEYRDEMYDFGADEEVPDDFSDPTRSSNFDLADASRLDRQAGEGIKESLRKAKEAKAEEKKHAEAEPKEEEK